MIPLSPMVLFYETQVPSLSTLVTHYLTNSLNNVVEAWLMCRLIRVVTQSSMVLLGQTCVNSNDGWSSVEILRLTFGQYSETEFWLACNLTWFRYFDESTQLLGPLCLWQYCISFATFLLFTTLQCFTFLPQPMLSAFIHEINPKMHIRWKSNTS